MLTVRFNNVGNGDSIIIQVDVNGKKIVGLIDCAVATKHALHPRHRNPTLNWLRNQTDVDVIDFMMLTHPHYDHYSGFSEVLQYCLDNGIRVNRFFHTLALTEQFKIDENIHANEIVKKLIGHVPENVSLLGKIFVKLKELAGRGLYDRNLPTLLLKERYLLGKEVFLQTLAPAGAELEGFVKNRKIVSFDTLSQKEENDLINSLSYVSYIKAYGDHFILFTADALPHTIQNVISDPLIKVDSQCNHRIIQVPHHGGDSYHIAELWDFFSNCSDKTAVISSGTNEVYQHPSHRVVKYIDDKGFIIHATNFVFGVTQLARSERLSGDQQFSFVGVAG